MLTPAAANDVEDIPIVYKPVSGSLAIYIPVYKA